MATFSEGETLTNVGEFRLNTTGQSFTVPAGKYAEIQIHSLIAGAVTLNFNIIYPGGGSSGITLAAGTQINALNAVISSAAVNREGIVVPDILLIAGSVVQISFVGGTAELIATYKLFNNP